MGQTRHAPSAFFLVLISFSSVFLGGSNGFFFWFGELQI
jgi:hypothetical protein